MRIDFSFHPTKIATDNRCHPIARHLHNIERTNAMPSKLNIIGKRFGRLIVLADAGKKPGGQNHRWSLCRCDCGKEKLVRNVNLISGAIRSCKCLHAEITSNLFTTHGHKKGRRATGTYQSWASMNARCTNPNCNEFKWYGGRGIRRCEGLKEFHDFLIVLGERPVELELDRWPNNKTGHYSCGKCAECLKEVWPLNIRWATRKQQMRNIRRNKMLTFRGITACLSEHCEQLSLSYGTILARLRKGWSIEESFTFPKNKKKFWRGRRLCA